MLEGASQTYDTPSLQLQQLAGFLLSFISYFLSQNRELIPSSHRSKDRLWRICSSPPILLESAPFASITHFYIRKEIHHITQAALIQLLTGEILR